ncbi:MAG: helix-turn-helix transcriptional regulator [Paucibacter sp.]|nr:helix-turn-helix transcriptional regulator [Roseateles sp.]
MHKSLHNRPNEIYLSLLRDKRLSRKLRQADLAVRLGRTQGVVSRVESGERRLDIVELWAWLNALDTDVVSFVRQLDRRLRSAAADAGARGLSVPGTKRATNS